MDFVTQFRKIAFAAVLVTMALAAGCSKDRAPAPAGNKALPQEGSAKAAPQGGAVYKVDPVHSMVLFRVKHFGVGYIHGRFNDISGTFTFDEKDPAKSSFALEVKADSVDTHVAQRDQHLKSSSFFNVKEFRAITFKSKEVKALGHHMYEVSGDLSLHGVNHPLTVKLEHVGTGKDPQGHLRSGFEAVFNIKRSDYGMDFMLGPVGDDVRVTVAFEGMPQ